MEQGEIQAIRQTMLRQESIFRQQVYELHRLYEQQKILLSKMNVAPPASTRNFLAADGNGSGSVQVDGNGNVQVTRKRPRSFDLEKIPDDDDDDCQEDDTYGGHHTYDHTTGADPPYVHTAGRTPDPVQYSQPRARATVEMSLFPIPSRVSKEKSELPLQQFITSEQSTVGWSSATGSVKLLGQESGAFWPQQPPQQQQPPLNVHQDPRWFIPQGSGAGFSLQPCNSANVTTPGGLNQWKNALLSDGYGFSSGGQQTAFGNRPRQNGTFANGFSLNYPLLNNVYEAVSKGNVQERGILWPQQQQQQMQPELGWLQQHLQAAASYIPQQQQQQQVFAAPKVEERRVFPEQSGSFWYSGSGLQNSSFLQPQSKAPASAAATYLPPFPKVREVPGTTSLEMQLQLQSQNGLHDVKSKSQKAFEGLLDVKPQSLKGVEGLVDVNNASVLAPVSGFTTGEQVPKVAKTEAVTTMESPKLPVEAIVSERPPLQEKKSEGPEGGVGLRRSPRRSTQIVDERKKEVSKDTREGLCSSKAPDEDELDMTISDTATILLSLDPPEEKASCSKAAASSNKSQALLEAKLLSDLKLFKSVTIMLKKDASAKTSNNKRVPRPCRQHRGGGGGGAGNGTSGGGSGGGGGGGETGKASGTTDGAPQSWLWGGVTRRKRMQRQRPQVHV